MIIPNSGAPPSVSASSDRKELVNELEGRLHFRPEGSLRVEFPRRQNGLQDRANIALGLAKGTSGAVDDRSGRVIGDEVAAEFERNEMRGGRMCRQELKHFHSIFHPALALNLAAQNHFFTVVVQARAENESPALARAIDGPTGKAARDVPHVLLSVAAVHAQGVEFHQLAPVVFVQAAAFRLPQVGLRRYALPGRRLCLLRRGVCRGRQFRRRLSYNSLHRGRRTFCFAHPHHRRRLPPDGG